MQGVDVGASRAVVVAYVNTVDTGLVVMVDVATKWVHVADGPLHAAAAALRIPVNFSTSRRKEEVPKGSIFLLSETQDSENLENLKCGVV